MHTQSPHLATVRGGGGFRVGIVGISLLMVSVSSVIPLGFRAVKDL